MNDRLVSALSTLFAATLTLISSVAVAKPDLVITGITIDPASPAVDEGTITATIKNQGDEGTCTFCNIDMKMYLDGKECDTGIIFAGLGKGSTATENTSSCNPKTPGPHVFKIVVDTEPDVDESNESNNTLEKTFTWKGPDLTVTKIWVDPGQPEVGDGSIHFNGKNIGGADAGGCLGKGVHWKVYLDGKMCDDGSLSCGLSAGQENEESTTDGDCAPTTHGMHEITVEMDWDGQFPEENEGNNKMTQSFMWYLPDLKITKMTIDPAKPYAEKEGTITATIKNDSPIGTGIFVNINVKMYLDGKECDTGVVLAGLGAGSEATEDTSNCRPKTPGKHKIKYVVDTDSDVKEMDESNNSLEVEFDWYWPDLVVTGVKMDPAQPKPKDKLNFTATIKNQGAVDIGCNLFNAINVQFLLDGKECATGLIICGLGAGATATEETGSCTPAGGGQHTLTTIVDYKKDVPEMDEANNTHEFKFGTCGDKELCNAIDDDCDGQTDEDFADKGLPCDGADADTCKAGAFTCKADGSGLECTGDVMATEICDGKDNDCNGQVDELWATKGKNCDGPDADTCESGTWTCKADGSGVECTGDNGAGPELCDSKDNDCDGKTDEDFGDLGQPCNYTKAGCTSKGKLACSADGKGTTCQNAATDKEELCNGKDDDCDGKTDETVGELGQPCRAGLGLCETLGQYACGTKGEVVCQANTAKPQTEACDDGFDNDCDGLIDEGCACAVEGAFKPCGSAVGECSAGVQWCEAGKWSEACANAKGPATEDTCGNKKDDDCDGSIDEGCTCTGTGTSACDPEAGVCAAGKQTCNSGVLSQCVAAGGFVPEVCDDKKDQDCDGWADERCACKDGSTIACATPSGKAGTNYQSTCKAGEWGPCLVGGGGTTGTADGGGTGGTGDAGGTGGSDLTSGGTDASSTTGGDAGKTTPKSYVAEESSGCASGGSRGLSAGWLAFALLGLALAARRRAHSAP